MPNEPVGYHHTRLVSSNPDHLGGFRYATSIFAGIESKFGLYFFKK